LAEGKRLFYDVGELGWTMYLAAHLKYLARDGRPASVVAPAAKRVFYRDCAFEMLPFPEEWTRRFGRYPADGNHLYNPRTRRRLDDQEELAGPIRKAYPGYDVVTEYGKFEGQTIFEPYSHSAEAEELAAELLGESRVVLAFPRHRRGKFRGRNLPRRQWRLILRRICGELPDLSVVAMGSRRGAYRGLKVGRTNFVDLVGYDDSRTLDLMLAMCNTGRAVAALGSQSGTVKITLLCGVPTYVIGHERKRHTEDENWAGTPVGFWEVGSVLGPRLAWDRKANILGYRLWKPGRMLRDLLGFLRDQIPE
jgi:hypothetical protein